MVQGQSSRQIASIASAQGWDVGGMLAAEPGEVRALVSGPSFPFGAVLSVREDALGRAEAVVAEARARQDSRSEHIVGVLETLGAAGSGRTARPPALLLEHAPGGTLAQLLARGDGLRAHEAATVLVGAASGLAALHAAGWAHTAVTPAVVVFRRDGCPALDGLGAARFLDPRTADRDREAFQRLVEAVCASVPSPVSWRMLTAASAALARHDWDAVIAGIVGVAEPGALDPFRLAAGRREAPVDVGADHERAPRGGSAVARGDVLPRHRPIEGGLLALVLDGDPVTELVRRIRTALRRRRNLVLVLVAPLVVAGAILAVVPAGAGPHTAASPSAPPSAPTTASRPTSSAGGAAGAPPDSAAPRSGDDPVRGDDPALAAASLLEERHRCFTAPEASPDCLAGVLQSGAPIVSAEASALGKAGAAGARDFRGAALTLVQRWGDAALVSCVPDASATPETKPASFLLVRNEAGWRIRDVLGD